jgi:hypothetical protein
VTTRRLALAAGPPPQAEGPPPPEAGATTPEDPGLDGYDEIDVEYYLDCIGGE